MVTVVTKTIGTGGGRDYSTLQSWEDAAPANLVTSDQVWRGECYNDAEFTAALTVSGSTVDATRYKELTVASGQAFADHADKLTNALRYNASNGAALRSTTAWSSALTVSENYFRLSRLQVYQDSSNGNGLTINNQGAVVDGVIVETRGGRALLLLSNSTATNSLFVSRKSSLSEVASIWDGCAVKNCVFAVPSDLTAATSVIKRLYWSGNTFVNCGFFGGTDAVSSATGATFTNCYTNDSTSIPSGCTTVAYDTSTGSGFESITNGTHDYRIKSTSALKDAGTSTGAPSVDIVGATRPSGSGYDVGCWEYAAGGGGAQTVAIAQASEADTAQAFSATVGSVTAIGQALEANAAQALATRQTKAIVQAVEADAAQALAAAQRKALGQAAETDTAQAFATVQRKAVGQATETDSAQPIAYSAPGTIGQVLETDAAQPIVAKQARAIGQASETGFAQPITAGTGIAVAIGMALEIDTAGAFVAPLLVAIGQALEVDAARAMTSIGGDVSIDPATIRRVARSPALTRLARSPAMVRSTNGL